MLHTNDSEARQFQQLKVAALREYNRQPPRVPLQAATVAPRADPIARPVLDLKVSRMSNTPPTVPVPTTTFRRKVS